MDAKFQNEVQRDAVRARARDLPGDRAMSTFSTEFPDFPAADYPVLPPGFTDSSWHNDACPSMSNERFCLSIYVDYADVKKRSQCDASPRFSVIHLDADGCVTGDDSLLDTDDWAEVLALIARHSIKGDSPSQVIVDDPEAS